MKKSEEYIEGRIRWKSKGYSLPTSKTMFWTDEAHKQSTEINAELGRPILISSVNDHNYIILYAYGILNCCNNDTSIVGYSNIDRITDREMKKGEKKSDLSCLVITLKNGNEIVVRPEPGEPAFAVWNIIKMLSQLS